MKGFGGRRARSGAVAPGWILPGADGVSVRPVFRFLHGPAPGPPVERGDFTATVIAISPAPGFVAHLLGGYVADGVAGTSGGLDGAMTAAFGLVVGPGLLSALALFGVLLSEGVAVPPAGFGFAGVAPLAGPALFLAIAMGGYAGGEPGEPSGA